MEMTLLGIVMLVRDVHPDKAPSPMEVTLFGMVISVRDSHPEKAYAAIATIPSGMVYMLVLLPAG